MENIKVVVPKSRIVESLIKGEKGEFTAYSVSLGRKDVRLTIPMGFVLPDGDVEGTLYGRKYTNKFGSFSEVAIFVENAVLPTDPSSVKTEEVADKDLPF